VREFETITSGPRSFAGTRYLLKAPDRAAWITNRQAASVIVGFNEWSRPTTGDPWRRDRYGGGGPPFRTASWFRWTPYAQSTRLLGVRVVNGRRVAQVALMDPGTPVWFRLQIDMKTFRVSDVRMIADGHFMHQHYYAFNRPLKIEPPRGR
jgi:hypothetical protein